MQRKVCVKDILNYIDGLKEFYNFEGDEQAVIHGFSSLQRYRKDSMTWIKKSSNIFKVLEHDIALAIIQYGEEVPDDIKIKNKIFCKESKKIFFEVLENLFVEKEESKPSIGQGTYISPKVKLGSNVIIGNNCVLDGNITIGNNTRIYHNVTIINNVSIGNNCNIESGVNIGHDGYSFTENDKHEKTMIKHYGGVSIGNNVHIGGQTHVARGTIDNTVIEDGVKIDTLIHIAHNCKIGKNSAIITGSLIYGSVELGSNVQITSGIVRNQKKIGDNSLVGIGSVIVKDISENTTVIGVPARELER